MKNNKSKMGMAMCYSGFALTIIGCIATSSADNMVIPISVMLIGFAVCVVGGIIWGVSAKRQKISKQVDEELARKRRFASMSEEEQLAEVRKSLNVELKVTNKDASVIKRGIAGQIIAGPAGAVVGALSAVDKNNKNGQASSTDGKDASVIKRGIAGQIIAGPTGAVIGALSAVDKNNKNAKNQSTHE